MSIAELDNVGFDFHFSCLESFDRQRRNVQGVSLSVHDLFGDQLPNCRSVLESVPAESIGQNETVEPRDAPENRMRVR